MKIRYYGHVGQSTGYGRAASDLCMALLGEGQDLEIRPLSPASARAFPPEFLPLANLVRTEATLDPNPDVIIIHTLPLDCSTALDLLRAAPNAPHPSTKVIAYTTWEALTVPSAVIARLEAFDQVWTPSVATENALADARLVGKLRRVPHCFDPTTLASRRARPAGRPTDLFSFYYVGAWTNRKNPAGLIRAFVNAFGKDDPVRLYMHCPGVSPATAAGVMGSCGVDREDMPRIEFSEGRVTEESVLDIHRRADCFVTAAHGEAWNLPAFDAMLAGRHVIAPMNLGSDDFLRDTSARLYGVTRSPAGVDVRLTDIDGQRFKMDRIGAQGLTARDIWVEPDLLELSNAMRFAADAKSDTLECHYDPVSWFGYYAVAWKAIEHLTEIK